MRERYTFGMISSFGAMGIVRGDIDEELIKSSIKSSHIPDAVKKK